MVLNEEIEENYIGSYYEPISKKEYEGECIVLPSEFKYIEALFEYCEKRSKTKNPTFIEKHVGPLKQLVGEHNYNFSKHIVMNIGSVIYSIPNINMRRILKMARR